MEQNDERNEDAGSPLPPAEQWVNETVDMINRLGLYPGIEQAETIARAFPPQVSEQIARMTAEIRGWLSNGGATGISEITRRFIEADLARHSVALNVYDGDTITAIDHGFVEVAAAAETLQVAKAPARRPSGIGGLTPAQLGLCVVIAAVLNGIPFAELGLPADGQLVINGEFASIPFSIMIIAAILHYFDQNKR
jgi:hypothetical protein